MVLQHKLPTVLIRTLSTLLLLRPSTAAMSVRVAIPHLSTSPIASSPLSPSSSTATPTERRARQIWKTANAVCFDVDSTVCENEAIDELADYIGVGEEVAVATRKAMNGTTRFRDALAARLEIMKPTRQNMEDFAQRPPLLTPGIKDLVKALHARGTDVYLVSGGFRDIIKPVADILQIPHSRIYANEILFDVHGEYAGFDENELTSDSGNKEVGKAGVCALLKRTHSYDRLVMVGDGATDLEAAPPADAFIGFGGNVARAAVREGADWFVNSFETLQKAM